MYRGFCKIHTRTHFCLHLSELFLPCSLAGSGIVISSIDNLPAQLPREATDYFGARLKPFIYDFVSKTTAPTSL